MDPADRHFWYIRERYGAHSFASSFSTFAGRISGPDAFWGLSFISSFITPWVVTSICGMVGAGSPSGVGLALQSLSLVNTD
ncbi:hypothetical protein DPMN_074186 [Dreissena polymorpha]|uniref:Uncharacterized protein n=1 Tax=Dreissena polymorpha TaxID=45954 RepID=A0A9D3YHX4_DREPO|nr:hypothetical protein DPMN_074186 [Dreissena polymorpha]